MYLPNILIPLLTLLSLATASTTRYPYLVVANSNCPCDTKRHEWCFEYTMYDVAENQCYNISHPSHGMKIYSPWVSMKQHVVCQVFGDRDCKGRTQRERSFGANWLCEMGSAFDDAYTHSSFRCSHADW